jgi:hypothetical protein
VDLKSLGERLVPAQSTVGISPLTVSNYSNAHSVAAAWFAQRGQARIKNLHYSARMALPVIIASGTTPRDPERLLSAAILPKSFSPDQFVQTGKAVLHTANRYLE